MDYSQLSDFEINGLVSKLTQRFGDFTQAGNKTFIHEYSDVGHMKGICIGWKEFDPCNNPADAWPIIIENKVMLSPHCADDEWKAQIYLGRDDILDNYASAWHKNPLRAAMIVFLMKQGHPNA
ncbi:TPA: DUF2591 domain-containing protein [Enterobacter cloacae]|nr:DUF2591 domain-containing protein [Enterobacter cloacae]